jgi:translation initiation factor 6
MKPKKTLGISYLELLSFNDNPNIGVFCRANDELVIIQRGLTKKVINKVASVLKTRLLEINIAEASIIGSLVAMNSNGIIVCDFIDQDAYKQIAEDGLRLSVIDDKINAAGNDILVNDNGALVHPDIGKKALDVIKNTFQVPVFQGTIAGLKTVGMAAVVTNKGLLCHPKSSEDEKRMLEKIFDVPIMIGTVNHGSPVIGSGMVANSHGAVIGNLTTGIELGRISEALGFLK